MTGSDNMGSLLRGHVDGVMRGTIGGWAADELEPERVVDVSVFFDGRKIAQVPCDLPRPDLASATPFSNLAHGFKYQIPSAIADVPEVRLTFRFSETGKPLVGGEVIIGSKRQSGSLQRDNTIQPAPIKPPSSHRELFNYLSLFEPTEDLYDLLARFSFEDTNSKDIFELAFGSKTLPTIEKMKFNVTDHKSEYVARDYLYRLLSSDEFQNNVLEMLLKAYPEKKRLIFLHIPKCAGTDFGANMSGRIPTIRSTLASPLWTSRQALFVFIARLTRNVPFFGEMFVYGHENLQYYTDRDLVRDRDRIFTIVRHPIDIAISQINYIITRLNFDFSQGKLAPDTSSWAATLGIKENTLDQTAILALGNKILFEGQLILPNTMCAWFGGSDLNSATKIMSKHNIEITTTEYYDAWKRERWGILSNDRLNKSEKFLVKDTLSTDQLNHLAKIYSEDIKLYEKINKEIVKCGKNYAFSRDMG